MGTMIMKFGMSVVALGAGAIIALSAPLSATAHDSLESSTPAEGETLTTLPAEFSVTGSEPLLALDDSTAGFALQVVDAAGAYYGDGCLTVSGATLSAAAALGDPGEYTLRWQVVSSDGHPTSGEITFTWAPSDPAVASPSSAAPPACGNPGAETSETTANANDGLWIGAAITGALVAGLVAIFVLRRRSKA